jgi:phosphocarrier protein HPr
MRTGCRPAEGSFSASGFFMENDFTEQTIEITNKLGIHARPATLFVKEAAKYTSEVLVLKNGQEVNGKSIMGIMMLAAECGSRITIKARGPDSEAAVQALVRLVQSKFNED